MIRRFTILQHGQVQCIFLFRLALMPLGTQTFNDQNSNGDGVADVNDLDDDNDGTCLALWPLVDELQRSKKHAM